MKMSQAHYAHIETAIKAKLENWPTAAADYAAGNFIRSERVKNLQQRFCFDLLYASIPSSWVCDELYPYLDDSHIFTALRKICPKVEKNY